MQTAIITVEKNLIYKPLGNKTQEYKKQLQTSASRGSYINNVKKKKSNKTYRNFKLITSDTEFRASTFTL